jgi:NADP-dependent 3-hydroxy acid dehydrogenase YdfG
LLEVLKLDVTDDESVKEAIKKIANERGTIDVLVNNAGYALVGPLEELSTQEFKEQFETNVFGVIKGDDCTSIICHLTLEENQRLASLSLQLHITLQTRC